MADTVFIGSTNLADYLTPIGLLKGFIGIPPAVGADYQIPGFIGAIPAILGRGPRNVSVGGLILGWDTVDSPLPQENVEEARDAYITKLEAFAGVVFGGGGTFNLTWRTTTATTTTDRTTVARYMGGVDDIETLTPWAGRVAVDFLLLDPLWH